jgi:hypothetical protein
MIKVKGTTQTEGDNRALKRISGHETDKLIGGCRKLQNEELHNLYLPSTITRMIKSTKMRWTKHTAHMA